MQVGQRVLCAGECEVFRITQLDGNRAAFLVHTGSGVARKIPDGTPHGWEALTKLVPEKDALEKEFSQLMKRLQEISFQVRGWGEPGRAWYEERKNELGTIKLIVTPKSDG